MQDWRFRITNLTRANVVPIQETPTKTTTTTTQSEIVCWGLSQTINLVFKFIISNYMSLFCCCFNELKNRLKEEENSKSNLQFLWLMFMFMRIIIKRFLLLLPLLSKVSKFIFNEKCAYKELSKRNAKRLMRIWIQKSFTNQCMVVEWTHKRAIKKLQ